MNIPAAIEPLIKEHMNSGQYENVEKLLYIALTQLKEERDDDLAGLRALIREGLEEIEQGETIPADEVFTELRARNASFQNNSSA